MMDSLLFCLFQMLILRAKWHVILIYSSGSSNPIIAQITNPETYDIAIPNKYFNGAFMISANCRPDNYGIKTATFIITTALPTIADEINAPIG